MSKMGSIASTVLVEKANNAAQLVNKEMLRISSQQSQIVVGASSVKVQFYYGEEEASLAPQRAESLFQGLAEGLDDQQIWLAVKDAEQGRSSGPDGSPEISALQKIALIALVSAGLLALVLWMRS